MAGGSLSGSDNGLKPTDVSKERKNILIHISTSVGGHPSPKENCWLKKKCPKISNVLHKSVKNTLHRSTVAEIVTLDYIREDF